MLGQAVDDGLACEFAISLVDHHKRIGCVEQPQEKLAACHLPCGIVGARDDSVVDVALLQAFDDRVLVETSTWSPPIDLWGVLERTMAAGYRPILAHPERYRYMRKEDYRRLHEMGVLLQMNLPSIVGSYRNESQERAEYLLGRGWYCMVGSDCHRFHALQEQDTKKVLDKKTIRQLADLMQGLPNRE